MGASEDDAFEIVGNAEGEFPQSALLLTDPEWNDLAAVCSHFLMATEWAENPAQHTGYSPRTGMERQPPTPELLRRRDIAKRVVEADSQ